MTTKKKSKPRKKTTSRTKTIKKRGKTKRYNINYSRIYGKKRKKK